MVHVERLEKGEERVCLETCWTIWTARQAVGFSRCTGTWPRPAVMRRAWKWVSPRISSLGVFRLVRCEGAVVRLGCLCARSRVVESRRCGTGGVCGAPPSTLVWGIRHDVSLGGGGRLTCTCSCEKGCPIHHHPPFSSSPPTTSSRTRLRPLSTYTTGCVLLVTSKDPPRPLAGTPDTAS